MAKVFHSRELSRRFMSVLSEELKAAFGDCKKIAIKLHFGEPKNTNSFRPEHIKPFCELLKGLGIDFFLYDSSVAYPGMRSDPKTHMEAALQKGYGELGEIRTNDDFVVSPGSNIDYQVAKELADAEGVLVITHFKGHVCCGFGGAIKNLGMGALTKKSKNDIHEGGKPVYSDGCVECGLCAKSCPLGGITVDGRPNFNLCYGCSNCTTVCPNDLIKPKLKVFDELLADGAAAAQKKFKRYYYISQLVNISRLCDCTGDGGIQLAEDAGYLASTDACSIDCAGHDVIVKDAGEDVFLKHNKKTGLEQARWAERFGMGKCEYKLVSLDDSWEKRLSR